MKYEKKYRLFRDNRQLTYCLWGCEEEKTLQYVNNPAINFTGGTRALFVYRHSRLSGYGIDRRIGNHGICSRR